MKKPLPLICVCFALFAVFSCKKFIEQKKQDMLVSAITNGVWIVEQYREDTSDITAGFQGYEFRFSENGTVTGTKDGNTANGTWTGDINTRTISSNFPNIGEPVKKLNGIWLLTDTYWDYVEALMTTETGKNQLHLRKKS